MKENCIEFPAIPGIFWNFCGGLKLQGITNKKIPPLYLRKNLLATAGNLNVNEQTKYKSVQFFFIPSYREKARNTELLIFEPAI